MLDFESPPILPKVVLTKEKLGGIVLDDSEAKLTGFDSEGTTTPGYLPTDVNMDGHVRYVGFDNDRDPILQNVGGTVPTAIRPQQLP